MNRFGQQMTVQHMANYNSREISIWDQGPHPNTVSAVL